MITLSQVQQAVNKQFKAESIKITRLDGKTVYLRLNGKLVKYINTGVTYSPTDATTVKRDQVNAKIKEIGDLLKSLGGVFEDQLYTFESENGSFSVDISVFLCYTDKEYPAYKDVYLDIIYYKNSLL